jgi:hypothetical protein
MVHVPSHLHPKQGEVEKIFMEEEGKDDPKKLTKNIFL